MKSYDGIVLFSGGLDSILAARLLMEQGRTVRCLHFTSPFFGKPDQVRRWERRYGLDIDTEDIGGDFAALLGAGPPHGFGSVLNPCVDCKILMMRRAKARMEEYGARFLASGEVIGQRPMSQRRDTLNIIRREADVRDLLLRPLCALRLDPTPAELSGLVDRSRLLGISGRGRTEQLELAARYGITDIPTPGGGCMLTEKENARRYWPLLKKSSRPTSAEFTLCNTGRQFWSGDRWLVIGRNSSDNEALLKLAHESDFLFKVAGYPGPLGLGVYREATGIVGSWSGQSLREAAAVVASYCPRAVREGGKVEVRIRQGGEERTEVVEASRKTSFGEGSWEEVREELAAMRRGEGRR